MPVSGRAAAVAGFSRVIQPGGAYVTEGRENTRVFDVVCGCAAGVPPSIIAAGFGRLCGLQAARENATDRPEGHVAFLLPETG
jgi:hypothetical protein